MCGRYRRTKTYADYVEEFSQTRIPLVFPPRERAPNLEPQGQVRPTDPAPILRLQADGNGLALSPARWWFVGQKHVGTFKDRPKLTTFNAKAETVATSWTFKFAFEKRRCLVPADGWYEWTGEPGRKTMWEFMPRDGRSLFFAGLWERFEDPEAGPTDTFTIITQPAGAPLNGYHDRAPVVLAGRARELWLDRDAPAGDLQKLLGPASPDAFDVRYVSGPKTKGML